MARFKCRRCGEEHGSAACVETASELPDGYYLCDGFEPLRPVMGPLTETQLDPKAWHSSFSNLRVARIAGGKIDARWSYMGAVLQP